MPNRYKDLYNLIDTDNEEFYEAEQHGKNMQKRADKAAKNMGWQKGKAVRDALSDDQVRVEYPPMDARQNASSMQSRANQAMREWANENPEAFKQFINEGVNDGSQSVPSRPAGLIQNRPVAPETIIRGSGRFNTPTEYEAAEMMQPRGGLQNFSDDAPYMKYAPSEEPIVKAPWERSGRNALFSSTDEVVPSGAYNPKGSAFTFKEKAGEPINGLNLWLPFNDKAYRVGKQAGNTLLADRYVPKVYDDGSFNYGMIENAYNRRPYMYDMQHNPLHDGYLSIQRPQLLENMYGVNPASQPTMAEASQAPSYNMVNGRPMVEMPESVSNNRLREQYLSDFRNRATANSNGRINLSDVGELMEQYPSMFEEKPAQGAQPYTARYNGDARIGDPIFSDAALEYGQGSTNPMTKKQAITERMANENKIYQDAIREGKLAMYPQNYDAKGRPAGTVKVPKASYTDYEDWITDRSPRKVAMKSDGGMFFPEAPSQRLEEAYREKAAAEAIPQTGIQVTSRGVDNVNSRLGDMYGKTETRLKNGELNSFDIWNKGQGNVPTLQTGGMKYPTGRGPVFNIPDAVRGAYQGAKGVAKGIGRAFTSPEMVATIGADVASELAEMQYLNAPTETMVNKLMQEGMSEEEARAIVGYNDEAYREAEDTSRPARWIREQDKKKRNYVYDDNPNNY